MTAPMHPVAIARVVDAIRQGGPVTPHMAIVLEQAGLLAAENTALKAQVAKLMEKPDPEGWSRTEKPRRVVDVAAEHAREMETRTTPAAELLRRRAAAASPPAVDAMKAHQARQEQQARLRQQRKRERDRQGSPLNPH
jgi:hypothetical protein